MDGARQTDRLTNWNTLPKWRTSRQTHSMPRFQASKACHVNWLLDGVADRPTALQRSTDWLADWLADWLTGWLTVLLTDWLADWLTVLLTDCLIGWLRTDWLTDCLPYWLTDWLTVLLADWLTVLLADWLTVLLTDWPEKVDHTVRHGLTVNVVSIVHICQCGNESSSSQ